MEGYLVLGACTLVAACTDGSRSSRPVSSLPPLPSGPPVVAAPNIQARPSYERAVQLSEQVKVGMPQSQVEAMFGPPDKAGYKVYGRATPQPWEALVWEYVFDDVTPPRALSIVFQQVQPGVWRVNHGDWPAP